MKLTKKCCRLTRLQLCYVLLAIFTVGAVVLRSVALGLFFDADVGYFRRDDFLIDLYIMEGIATSLCFALPFLIKKEARPTADQPLSLGALVGAGLSALTLAVVAFYLLMRREQLHAPTGLVLITALLLVVGAGYFVGQFRTKQDTATVLVFGYGLILALACLLAVTYFDLYTQMNAPHKVSLHLCLLATMAAVLFELRVPLGRPLPHVHAAVCGFACFITATCGLSNTVGFLVGAYDNATYLLCDLCCVGLCVYFAAKCVALATGKEPNKEESAT